MYVVKNVYTTKGALTILKLYRFS